MKKQLIFFMFLFLLCQSSAAEKQITVSIELGSVGNFKAYATWILEGTEIECQEDQDGSNPREYDIQKDTTVEFTCTTPYNPPDEFSGEIQLQPSSGYDENSDCKTPLSIEDTAEEVECDSCQSCEQAINDAEENDTVLLTSDINENKQTCILWENDGITFDCQSNKIVVTGSWSTGIKLSASDNNVIDKCHFSNLKFGLYLNESDNNQVKNTAFQDTERSLLISGSSGNSVTGSLFQQDTVGVELVDASSNLVRNNDFFDTTTGIKVYDSSQNTIRENNIKKGDPGIFLHAGSELNSIYDNKILNSKSAAIDLSNTQENTIENNTLGTGKNVGVHMRTGAERNMVVENKIKFFDQRGMHFSAGADENLIRENTIAHNKQEGVLVSNCQDNEFIENNISYNEKKGIWLQFSSGILLQNNTVCFNPQEEDIVTDGSSASSESDNNFCDSTVAYQDKSAVIGCVNNCNYNSLNVKIESISGDCPLEAQVNITGASNPKEYKLRWSVNGLMIDKWRITKSLDSSTDLFTVYLFPTIGSGSDKTLQLMVESISGDHYGTDSKENFDVPSCDCLSSSGSKTIALAPAIGSSPQGKTNADEVIVPSSSLVSQKTTEALSQAKSNYGWSDPLTAEQRMHAVFDWVYENVGYLCDQTGSSACADNCDQCDNPLRSVCQCTSYSCTGADIYLSGEETLDLTHSCCDEDPPSGGHDFTYFGDCDDKANLYASMVRSAGVSPWCVASIVYPGHLANAARVNGRWEYIETTNGYTGAYDWENMINGEGLDVGVHSLTDHIGYSDIQYMNVVGD